MAMPVERGRRAASRRPKRGRSDCRETEHRGEAMRTVLSAFTQREGAQLAAAALGDAGLTRGAVDVRVRRDGDDPSLGHPVDEFVTGGALTDFVWLLDRLFGSAGAGRPEASGADIVRQGGAVVVVEAADDDEAARVQAFLLEAGATQQAFLPREGDLD
jgi:hypothetical protein